LAAVVIKQLNINNSDVVQRKKKLKIKIKTRGEYKKVCVFN